MNNQLLIGITIVIVIAVAYYLIAHKPTEFYSPTCSSVKAAYIEKIGEIYGLLHTNFYYSMRNHNIPDSVWQSDILNRSLNSIRNAANATAAALRGKIGHENTHLAVLIYELNHIKENIKHMNKSVADAFFHAEQNQVESESLIYYAADIANQITALKI